MPRNGAFTLQGVNRADDDTEQRRLILCAEDASHCGEALRPTTRKRPAAAGHAQHEGAAVFRIGQFLDKCLAQKRRRRVARGRLTDVEVRGHGARAKPARALDKQTQDVALRRRQAFDLARAPIILAGKGAETGKSIRELIADHNSKDNYINRGEASRRSAWGLGGAGLQSAYGNIFSKRGFGVAKRRYR